MTTLNWEQLESILKLYLYLLLESFQKQYKKTQERLTIVRQNLLNRKIDEAVI